VVLTASVVGAVLVATMSWVPPRAHSNQAPPPIRTARARLPARAQAGQERRGAPPAMRSAVLIGA
jgi:hypothetical protein